MDLKFNEMKITRSSLVDLPYCYITSVWNGNIFLILCLGAIYHRLATFSLYKCYMEYRSTLVPFHPYLKAKPMPFPDELCSL